MSRRNRLTDILITGVLAGCFMISASAAHIGVATIQGEGLRLRTEPSLEGTILTEAHKGEKVALLEQDGDWYKVDYAGQTGYMSAGFLETATSLEADLGYGMVTTAGDTLNLRSGAGTNTDKLTAIPCRSVLTLEGFQDGWYKVTYNGYTGYVSSDYITIVDASGNRADGAVADTASTLGQAIVAEAMKHVGKPYVYGSKGPNSFDCSGFAYYCAKQAAGIYLNGGATTQWNTAPGQRIYSIDQLQPGDLFFINDPSYGSGKAVSHVGIYIGNGQMVHASTSRTGVLVTSIEGRYTRYFVGGIRLG